MHTLDFPGILLPIFAIACMFGIPIISIVLYWWYEIRKVTCEAALKQAMIARGYSANEIVHVLTNGKGKLPNPAFDLPPAKPVQSVA
jgi:hypothetical protein